MSSSELPVVLVNDQHVRSPSKSKSNRPLSKSLNYDALQEIVQLKNMSESGELRSDVLRDRFLSAYPKILSAPKPKQKPTTEEQHNLLSTSRSARSFGQLSARAAGKFGYTAPRLVELSRPKRNHEKEQEGLRYDTHMHDLKHHLEQLHDTKISITFQQRFNSALADLRTLLAITPFERSAVENARIAEAVVDMQSPILEHVSRRHLKEVMSIATLETYKEDEMTVFGNTGLFMVLKGAVHPFSLPVVRNKDDDIETLFRQPTPTLKNLTEYTLEVGECFGTLKSLPNRSVNSRVLAVNVKYAGTEVMKISASAYEILMNKLKASDHAEKLSLLRKCPQYAQWPQLSLDEIADVLQWIYLPRKEMIVVENTKAPFIGMIAKGVCNAYRTIDTMHKLSNNTRERRLKQMLIGRMATGSTFGEISLIEDDNITCSIVTSTPVKMAIITPQKLSELNAVTISLIQQSNKPTFAHVNTEWLKEEYVKTESGREWTKMRARILAAALRENQIAPGTGKWARPHNQLREAKILTTTS